MDPYSCWVDGKVGIAVQFNQNSYVDCGSSNKLDVYDEYTIEGWVKPSTSGINDRRLITRGASSKGGYLIQLWSTNKICFYQSVNGSLLTLDIMMDFPHDGKFHHFAMTFKHDGTNSAMTVYLDGEKIGDNSVVGAPDYPAEEAYRVLKIGGNNFEGIIDEVRIFSRALTDKEVEEHYQLSINTLIFRR